MECGGTFTAWVSLQFRDHLVAAQSDHTISTRFLHGANLAQPSPTRSPMDECVRRLRLNPVLRIVQTHLHMLLLEVVGTTVATVAPTDGRRDESHPSSSRWPNACGITITM
jgi:hypothetical protein